MTGVSQDAAVAKGSSTATMPSDRKELVRLAAKINGLTGPDVQPWHLKASFQLFDEQGKVTGEGTYEELWVSPSKHKRIFTSGAFTQTEFVTDKGIMRSGAHDQAPELLTQIRGQFINPIPLDDDQIEHSTFDLQRPSAGAAAIRCMGVTASGVPPKPQPLGSVFCLDPNLPAVRIVLRTGVADQVLRNHLMKFQGRYLAQDLEGNDSAYPQPNEHPLFTAHLDIAETLKTINESDFTPPGDAVTPPKRIELAPDVVSKMLLQHPKPVYPPIAQAACVQGTVVLKAIISADGIPQSLRVVSGPAMLQQAALDSVKKWTYKPFMVDGELVQVETTINVPFTIGIGGPCH